ncbi:MAG: 50S ribosomal protein L6 [Candidatus Moraniibacteriota bacterium]|nr:MAG: 50S ribosomal protein L6 [Candidatus Moranbacteria bacterium]
MSRIGKKPISIPEKVEVTLAANVLTVKGSKGTLTLTHHYEVALKVEDGKVLVEKKGSTKRAQALWGTTAKLIQNMIEGVTNGFTKQLELNGVGYRMNLAGKKLNLALGFSHPVVVELPASVEAKIENNVLTLVSIDKQVLGEFAAYVRKQKPVEPYKGKGFRYVGEQVRRKEGKKAGAA